MIVTVWGKIIMYRLWQYCASAVIFKADSSEKAEFKLFIVALSHYGWLMIHRLSSVAKKWKICESLMGL